MISQFQIQSKLNKLTILACKSIHWIIKQFEIYFHKSSAVLRSQTIVFRKTILGFKMNRYSKTNIFYFIVLLVV